MESTTAVECEVAFATAYWAWLRGERAQKPSPEQIVEKFGLCAAHAAVLVRQIKLTDAYRQYETEQHKRLPQDA